MIQRREAEDTLLPGGCSLIITCLPPHYTDGVLGLIHLWVFSTLNRDQSAHSAQYMHAEGAFKPPVTGAPPRETGLLALSL